MAMNNRKFVIAGNAVYGAAAIMSWIEIGLAFLGVSVPVVVHTLIVLAAGAGYRTAYLFNLVPSRAERSAVAIRPSSDVRR